MLPTLPPYRSDTSIIFFLGDGGQLLSSGGINGCIRHSMGGGEKGITSPMGGGRQVKEAKTEIQSLTFLLEKQKQDVELLVTEQEPKPEDRVDEPVNCVGIINCIGANPSDCISLGGHCPTFSQEELDEMVKPKKKRRGRKKPPMEVKKK